MDGETLLNSTPLIDAAVEDIINEFYDDGFEVETEAYHFVYRITDWLEKNQGDETDPDILAQKWLDDEGYDAIRDRIHYFG